MEALTGAEQVAAETHLASCARCAHDLASLRRALDLLADDPVRDSVPPLALGALHARVASRLDEIEGAAGARGRPRPWALAGLAAVAAAIAVLLWRPHVTPEAPSPVVSTVPTIASSTEGTEAAVERLDHALARERAVRYLSEAEDVLVGVASNPRVCVRKAHRVDMGEEAQRSRELLERRALLVEMDAPAVASARGVLVDVEGILREVASLDACANPHELEAIREEISRRRLLMKIDLMTRELQG
jgi:hypothetical protein